MVYTVKETLLFRSIKTIHLYIYLEIWICLMIGVSVKLQHLLIQLYNC